MKLLGLSLILALLAAPLLALQLSPDFQGTHFDKAVWVADPGFGPYRFVVEQDGRIWAVEADGRKHLMLDIHDRVRRTHTEEGLLCMALDPDFAAKHTFYIYYSVPNANPRTNRLSRFHCFPQDFSRADPSSEEVIFEAQKKWGNHNGSTLLFGKDGDLYFGLGDGGSGGDPDNNAQNLGSVLGKILRIDVEKPAGGKLYSPASGNPFLGREGARPEIWAYGLRNPWRMSFDRETGELWVGDVGQDRWEEIDRVHAGGNYGWNLREGKHDFKGHASPELIEPFYDYGRNLGFCVTGGYVYRGKKLPELEGKYIFGDFGSRRIWALDRKTADFQEITRAAEPICSFAEDRDGELSVIGYAGEIYRLSP